MELSEQLNMHDDTQTIMKCKNIRINVFVKSNKKMDKLLDMKNI